jgi:hypothetical protein
MTHPDLSDRRHCRSASLRTFEGIGATVRSDRKVNMNTTTPFRFVRQGFVRQGLRTSKVTARALLVAAAVAIPLAAVHPGAASAAPLGSSSTLITPLTPTNPSVAAAVPVAPSISISGLETPVSVGTFVTYRVAFNNPTNKQLQAAVTYPEHLRALSHSVGRTTANLSCGNGMGCSEGALHAFLDPGSFTEVFVTLYVQSRPLLGNAPISATITRVTGEDGRSYEVVFNQVFTVYWSIPRVIRW